MPDFKLWVERAILKDAPGACKVEGVGKILFKRDDGHKMIVVTRTCTSYGPTVLLANQGLDAGLEKLMARHLKSLKACMEIDDG